MREKGKGGVQREVCSECLFEYWSEDTVDYDDHDGHKKILSGKRSWNSEKISYDVFTQVHWNQESFKPIVWILLEICGLLLSVP